MQEDLKHYLDKILKSNEFSASEKYQKLLRYLVEASIKGNVPKEYTIAIEVFNMDANDESTGESNVRVYIHNLRKKLASYYLTEGKEDKFRFHIPVGRYKVEFINAGSPEKSKIRRIVIPVLIFAFTLTIVNIFYFGYYQQRQDEPDESTDFIWNGFLEREEPLLVVIGDYYLVNDEGLDDRIRFLRDTRINSDDDLQDFITEYPELSDDYSMTRLTMLGKYAPVCIHQLSAFFNKYGKSFEIILASEFSWQDLNDHHVIFIGSFKTLGLFRQYLKNANFRFTISPNELEFHQLEPDSVYHYYSFDSDVNDAYESDFPVVSLLPGPKNNKVILFISSRDIGLIATIEQFTNTHKIKSFREAAFPEKVPEQWFEACFMVRGLQRNPTHIELLHVNHPEASGFFKK